MSGYGRGARLEVISDAEIEKRHEAEAAEGRMLSWPDWVVLDIPPSAIPEVFEKLETWMRINQARAAEIEPNERDVFQTVHLNVRARHPITEGAIPERKREWQPSLLAEGVDAEGDQLRPEGAR